MESMSDAPYLLPKARFGFRMGDAKAIDAMIQDGLRNPFTGKHMIEEASDVAAELELTRPDMDRWALRSHQLAVEATDDGRLPEEIVPVTVKSKKGEDVVEVDEAPRRETSLEVAGQAAAAQPGRLPHRRQQPRASTTAPAPWSWPATSGPRPTTPSRSRAIIAHAQVADDYPYLARTPAAASKKALEKAGLSADDIDLWEINEAFASVTLNSIRVLGIDEDKVNVNGGAVAIGHPIGASGARILGALVQELHRRGGGKGVVAICSGGGQGDAVVLEVFGNGS